LPTLRKPEPTTQRAAHEVSGLIHVPRPLTSWNAFFAFFLGNPDWPKGDDSVSLLFAEVRSNESCHYFSFILEMNDGEQTPRRGPTKSGTKETPYAREDPPSQVMMIEISV
jgi:hypothetical protein